ncbi:MAG: hypothetical protein ACR2Q4_11975 [Geminicoccaceae bacterium]
MFLVAALLVAAVFLAAPLVLVVFPVVLVLEGEAAPVPAFLVPPAFADVFAFTDFSAGAFDVVGGDVPAVVACPA